MISLQENNLVLDREQFMIMCPNLSCNLSPPKRKEVALKDYTSYFGMLRKLPKDIVPISICIENPAWWNGLNFKDLAPTREIFFEYRSTGDESRFAMEYRERILENLSPYKTFHRLKSLSNHSSFALICYESPNRFCHRHLVADWFEKNGFLISEFQPFI